MEFPAEVRKRTEEIASYWKPDKLKSVSDELSEKYKNESGKDKSLTVTKEDTVVYSLVRMPATFSAVAAALEYTFEIVPELKNIKTAVDVGSGTGASIIAAYSMLDDLSEITCVEREKNMREIGIDLTEKFFSSSSSVKWLGGDILRDDIPQSAGLVMESYMLNELSPENRIKVIDKLWNSTEKLLLLTEPGTQSGFEVLKAARTQLLSKGAYIAAPCPHMANCRLSFDDWCHFTVRVQRSKLHKYLKGGDVPYEDEKFSYMAFVKEKPETKGARILRHPYIEKGMIKLKLCTETENKDIIITKKYGEVYKQARKSECGDIIKI